MPRAGRNLLLRNGIYHVRIQLNGREYWRSTGHTTEASALRKADEIKVSLRNERDWKRATADPTFQQWAETYLTTYSVKKKASERDRFIIGPAIEAWGRRRLGDLRRSHAERYLQDRGKRLAASTVTQEHNVLKAVMERAVEEGLITENPFKKVPRVAVKPRIRVLTHKNEALLRSLLSPAMDRWLTFMLGTGLRIKEARAISIHEVDFKRELVNVPADAAKGGKARGVPLRHEVAEAIRAQQASVGLLWPSHPVVYRDLLTSKAKEAKIPHLSPHDLRHTFATRYLQGGGDIFILSRILGHASVAVTEKFYVHLDSADLVERSRHVRLGAA